MSSLGTGTPGSPSTREKAKLGLKKKSGVKTRKPVTIQSVKSLPLDFRFTSGSPAGKGGDRSESDHLAAVVEEEDVGNMDSPYSSNSGSLEVETKVGGPELEVLVDLPARSRLPAISSSRIESRWSDTSSYGAKKVRMFSLDFV